MPDPRPALEFDENHNAEVIPFPTPRTTAAHCSLDSCRKPFVRQGPDDGDPAYCSYECGQIAQRKEDEE